jgi:hypothetical protein
MFLVTKLNVESLGTKILYADCKHDSKDAKLLCMQAIFDNITELKIINSEYQMTIINNEIVHCYERCYLFGKELKYVFEIIETHSLHVDDSMHSMHDDNK